MSDREFKLVLRCKDNGTPFQSYQWFARNEDDWGWERSIPLGGITHTVNDALELLETAFGNLMDEAMVKGRVEQ